MEGRGLQHLCGLLLLPVLWLEVQQSYSNWQTPSRLLEEEEREGSVPSVCAHGVST